MSKYVTLHGFGNWTGDVTDDETDVSTSVELNFEVVGGTTEPENPNENMIWVNTDVDITAYHFCNESICTGLGEGNFLNATNVINGVGDNGINFLGQLQPTWSNTYLYKTRLIAGITYHLDSTGLGYGRIGAFSAPSSNEGENQIPLVGGGTLNAVLNPGVSSAIFTPAITTDAYFYYCSDAGNTGANPAFSTWFALYLVGNPVWISTGMHSVVEFNALKQNSIQVYPTFAKQYINNTWVDITAKSYQNDTWVDWIHRNVLYNAGVFSDVSGSLTQTPMDSNSDSTDTFGKPGTCYVTLNDSDVTISSKAGLGAFVYFNKKIDLTLYDTLYFIGGVTINGTGGSSIGIWSDIGSYRDENKAASLNEALTDGTHMLDVSYLSGEHYVGFFVYGFENVVTITMRQMYLE